VRKWHDAAYYSGATDPIDFATVYAESTTLSDDECGAYSVITRTQKTGVGINTGVDIPMRDGVTYYGPEYGRFAGQLLSKFNDGGTDDCFDYELGEWDPGTRTFNTLGSSDHDVRKAIYHTVAYSLGYWYVASLNPDAPGDDVNREELYTGDSGTSFNGGSISMVPYKSTKEVKI